MLTIKELAPYLPYRLKGKSNQYDSIDLLLGIYGTMGHSLTLCHRINNHNTCDYDCNVNEFKPILRPLSDLDIYKVKDLFGESISDFRYEKIDDFSFEVYTEMLGWTGLSYDEYTAFFRFHYDVFGLIEKGLAIDINKLVK